MATIYFTYHQKFQLADYLKKYPYIIYVTIVIRNGKIVWKHGAYLAELQC